MFLLSATEFWNTPHMLIVVGLSPDKTDQRADVSRSRGSMGGVLNGMCFKSCSSFGLSC
jgi:hypothetical protein